MRLFELGPRSGALTIYDYSTRSQAPTINDFDKSQHANSGLLSVKIDAITHFNLNNVKAYSRMIYRPFDIIWYIPGKYFQQSKSYQISCFRFTKIHSL